jgi:monovalent cation:H+ antiporter-2, CPA2 family
MNSPMQSDGLNNLLVILGAAGIVIPAFARLRITPIIGFILVGILVGPMGLGALTSQYPWLDWITINDAKEIEPIGQYGIILLLFSIGLELSFKRLWTMRRLVFGLGALQLLGCGLIIAIALSFFGNSIAASAGIGIALALSSTALVLPISGTKSAVGKSALAMLLFEDLAIVPIIFILGAIGPQAGNAGFEGLFTTLWQGSLLIAAMMILGRYLLPILFGQAARTKSPELFLSASLLVVITASLATGAAGLSPIVGALIAGLLIAETDYQAEVEMMTEPFRGLALGVFLISIGMAIDLKYVIENWMTLIAATTGVLILKTIVTGGLLKLSGARTGTATEAGVLMSSPSETTLIVLGAAASAALISQETSNFWQVATAIGLTITPILARVGHDIANRIELRNTEQSPLYSEPANARCIVVGFGRVGHLVADMLHKHDLPYVAVESSIDAVTSARRHQYPVIFGDVSRPSVLEKLQIAQAKALILTMDEPILAAKLVRTIRQKYPSLTIISRARDIEHAAELYRAGVTEAVPETLESSLQLSESVLVDLGIPMGFVIASIHEKREEYRRTIMATGGLDEAPKLKSSSAD